MTEKDTKRQNSASIYNNRLHIAYTPVVAGREKVFLRRNRTMGFMDGEGKKIIYTIADGIGYLGLYQLLFLFSLTYLTRCIWFFKIQPRRRDSHRIMLHSIFKLLPRIAKWRWRFSFPKKIYSVASWTSAKGFQFPEIEIPNLSLFSVHSFLSFTRNIRK